jgi:adenosyl cobinamide kinase/adenosyl cobinamide phosphate guanylyltransferase
LPLPRTRGAGRPLKGRDEPEDLPVNDCLEERATVKLGATPTEKPGLFYFKGVMILILGGARSGKSRMAVGFAKKQCKRAVYVATAPVCDEEMRLRVALHKKARPKKWVTIETQVNIVEALKKILKNIDGIIIECLGTYIGNLMEKGLNDKGIIREVKGEIRDLKKLHKAGKKIFIVSNEVGGGVIPHTQMGRRFRDLVGTINQAIAKEADEVYLVTAGLPLRLK